MRPNLPRPAAPAAAGPLMGKGDRLSPERARLSGASFRGHSRRQQDRRQVAGGAAFGRAGRPAPARRSDGISLPCGPGAPGGLGCVTPRKSTRPEKLLAEWRDAGGDISSLCHGPHSLPAMITNAAILPGRGRSVRSRNCRQAPCRSTSGPGTRECFIQEIERAKTVFWNGPMGAYKRDGFKTGTEAVIRAVAAAAKRGAMDRGRRRPHGGARAASAGIGGRE